MGFFSQAFLVFLMKESKKRRRKQVGKFMSKPRSKPVNLPGAQPLMNPRVSLQLPWVLPYMGYIGMCRCVGYGFQAVYSDYHWVYMGI